MNLSSISVLIILFAVLLVVVFAIVYHAGVPDYSFYSVGDGATKQKLSLGEGFYMSVGTQSLLGLGDYAPVTRQGRAAVAIQSAFTLGWFVALGILSINA